MKELINLIEEVQNNIKVDEKNEVEPFVNSYYIEERLKLILASLIIENGIESISKKQN